MDCCDKVCLKIMSIYFRVWLCINCRLGLPAQTKKEIKIFKLVLNSLFKSKKIRVFEWGSGFSSIYFSEYLKNKGVDFEWHSVDNNREWNKKVQSMILDKKLEKNLKIYIEEFSPFWEKPGGDIIPPHCGVLSPKLDSEKMYIDCPKRVGGKFDLIFIDARFRRRCIQIAKEVVATDGVVILHDAQKDHYQVGLEVFKHGEFFKSGKWGLLQKEENKIWVGGMGENSSIILEEIKHNQ